jgi:hypothetical protein
MKIKKKRKRKEKWGGGEYGGVVLKKWREDYRKICYTGHHREEG